jgi:hypothetical protein
MAPRAASYTTTGDTAGIGVIGVLIIILLVLVLTGRL